jgi:hypothetical protein
MENVRLLNPIFKLLILAVLATWLWVLTIGAVVQSPKLTIESQPDSPVHLSVFQIAPSELNGSSVITLMVKNETANSVRAFAVALSEGKSKTGVLLFNSHNDQQMLRANEIKPITLRKTDEEILAGVTFSIDYVEFEDGSKWGADTFDSANSLAGERDGLRQAVAALADRLRTQGVTSLSRDLEPTITAISMPRTHSANWEQGFQRGVSIVRTRLKRALEKGGNEKLLVEWERIVAESKKNTTP